MSDRHKKALQSVVRELSILREQVKTLKEALREEKSTTYRLGKKLKESSIRGERT